MDQVAEWFQCASGRNGMGLKVDATAVCHEIRCPGLEQGVQTCVSFQVLGGGHEQEVEVGGLCDLRSLQLSAVLLLRVYASGDEPHTASRAQRKACGEVHIPLRQLVSKYDNMLYHTWLTLEKPGLLDSVASMGLFAPTHEEDAFAQAMHNGSRQLHQPQVCVSICKSEDLGPNGQPTWTVDASKRDRIARWAPLLRAQQQATMLCTLQHLQNPQPSKTSGMEAPQKQSQALEEQEREQKQELRDLRERLRACQEQGGIATQPLNHDDDRWNSLRQINDKGFNQLEQSRRLVASLQNRGRDGPLGMELERQRNLAAELKREHDALLEDLASTEQEAQRKFRDQEEGIDVLKQSRDDALTNYQHWQAEVQQLIRATDELTAEKARLLEQKDGLVKIVEDLHEACGIAGLPTGGREPINSIMGFNYP
jgi:hypothetical protein